MSAYLKDAAVRPSGGVPAIIYGMGAVPGAHDGTRFSPFNSSPICKLLTADSS